MLSSGNRDVHGSLVSSSLGAGATYSTEHLSRPKEVIMSVISHSWTWQCCSTPSLTFKWAPSSHLSSPALAECTGGVLPTGMYSSHGTGPPACQLVHCISLSSRKLFFLSPVFPGRMWMQQSLFVAERLNWLVCILYLPRARKKWEGKKAAVALKGTRKAQRKHGFCSSKLSNIDIKGLSLLGFWLCPWPAADVWEKKMMLCLVFWPRIGRIAASQPKVLFK